MTELYLVRHGETDWNKQGRVQGSTDIPLNDTGREQARQTGRMLASRHWNRVVSSPLSRAFETGEIIARELGLPAPTTHAGLVERNYGEAEGRTGAEIDRHREAGDEIPGREEIESVLERVLSALRELADAYPGETLIVTTHGAVIRALINTVDPSRAVPRHQPIMNGSVHSFRIEAGQIELLQVDARVTDDVPDDELSDPSVVAQTR